MPKPTQPALIPVPAKTKPARTEAQKAAWERVRSLTRIQRDYPETHRLPDAHPAGSLLYDARTGLVLEYRYTFQGTDNETYIMGVVVDCLAGLRPHPGSVWARRADQLRRVIRK